LLREIGATLTTEYQIYNTYIQAFYQWKLQNSLPF
jgi:hypothetical protein